METQNNIKSYSKKVLSNINDFLKIEPSKQDNRITVPIKFYNYYTVANSLESIISVIATICEDENRAKEHHCDIMNLCDIAKQIIPSEEMEFLDKLVIKESYDAPEDFAPIKEIS